MSSAFAATTIEVRHSDDTVVSTVSTLADAVAAATTAGDIIDIKAFDADFDIGAGINLGTASLICSAANQATLKLTAKGTADGYDLKCGIAMQGGTIRNIKIVGRGAAEGGDHGLIVFGGTFTMDKCTFTDFYDVPGGGGNGGSCLWLATYGAGTLGGSLSATITNSYFVNGNAGVFLSSAGAATSVLFDHCTFAVGTSLQGGGKVVGYDGTWLTQGNDGSESTFKNCLFLGQYGSGAAFFAPGAGATPNPAPEAVKIVHTNNAYLNIWTRFWGIADPGVALDATEIEYSTGSTEQNGYPNYINNDYTLPYSSPLRGKASDGGSIGAFQGGLPATMIVVTHESVDTVYTDMPTARANFVPGDTMDIRAHEGPMPWSGNCPSWSTVKCTAATPATLIVDNTDGNSFGALDHNTISNLIIDGGSTPGSNKVAGCFSFGVKSTVTDCTIKGFWWNPVYITAGDGDEGVTFTNCYISNTGSCVSFNSEYIGVGQTCTNKVTLNHCTLVSTTSWPIDVDANYAGKNFSNIFSIRNTILSAREPDRAIIYNAAIPAGTVIDEDYNLFDMTWMCFWAPSDTGIEAPAGSHSVKYDSTTDPANEFFADFANGDYRLKTPMASNPCIGAGENGSDIGAFQAPKPNAVRQWNLFE